MSNIHEKTANMTHFMNMFSMIKDGGTYTWLDEKHIYTKKLTPTGDTPYKIVAESNKAHKKMKSITPKSFHKYITF